MELVVGLLKSKNVLVLSAVCAAIATIARDETNLAILSDLKVIYKLANLGELKLKIQIFAELLKSIKFCFFHGLFTKLPKIW